MGSEKFNHLIIDRKWHNIWEESKTFKVEKGSRIAQMVLCPIEKAKIREVEDLEKTYRGSSGFGSTGTK